MNLSNNEKKDTYMMMFVMSMVIFAVGSILNLFLMGSDAEFGKYKVPTELRTEYNSIVEKKIEYFSEDYSKVSSLSKSEEYAANVLSLDRELLVPENKGEIFNQEYLIVCGVSGTLLIGIFFLELVFFTTRIADNTVEYNKKINNLKLKKEKQNQHHEKLLFDPDYDPLRDKNRS